MMLSMGGYSLFTVLPFMFMPWQIRHLGTEVRDVLIMMIHTLSGKISDSKGGIDKDH